jgi:hypothetical protein
MISLDVIRGLYFLSKRFLCLLGEVNREGKLDVRLDHVVITRHRSHRNAM